MITIPTFYAVVAASSSLAKSVSVVGNWTELLEPLEFGVLVFGMGVAVVTILDTSITYWTLANSDQITSLNLMDIDGYGGMGKFYSLITWNAVSLGSLSILQASRLLFPIRVSKIPAYVIPVILGVPLLLLLTWLVSNYFLYRRVSVLKQKYIDRVIIEKGIQGDPVLTSDEKRLLDTLDANERRNLVKMIRAWPRTGSVVVTVIVGVILQAMVQILGIGKVG